MAEFQITSQKLQNGIILISVKGSLDAHTFEEMEKTINQLFENNMYRLIVDLSKLDYISSAGAGVFIGAISTAQENDGLIVLLKPNQNVREVFDLLGLSQIFTITEDMQSAVKSFG